MKRVSDSDLTDNAAKKRPSLDNIQPLTEEAQGPGVLTQSQSLPLMHRTTSSLFTEVATRANRTHPKSLVPEDFSKQCVNQIVSAVGIMRQYREEYKNKPKYDNTVYETKVANIINAFANEQYNQAWDERVIIERLHKLCCDHRYLLALPLDEQYQNKVKQQRNQQQALADITESSASFIQSLYDRCQKTYYLEASDVKLAFSEMLAFGSNVNQRNGHFKLTANGLSIANIRLLYPSKPGESFKLYCFRPSIIRVSEPLAKKKSFIGGGPTDPAQDLQANGQVIEAYLNDLGERLINGKFKDQNEAIDLLINYKFLSSLVFSIEMMNGTQFKNIVKLNYLCEYVKHHYPKKIDKHLTILYPYSAGTLVQPYLSFACPEFSNLLLDPATVIANEKKAVMEHLKKANSKSAPTHTSSQRR